MNIIKGLNNIAGAVASVVAGEAKERLDKLTGSVASLADGKVTIEGFHPSLAKADPASMAGLLATKMPPFSSLATNVETRTGSDGRVVTSYDITPGLGPKFAYKVAASSDFEITDRQGRAHRFSVVELDIGADAKAGAKSAYTGKAFHIYGEGWAAELWDDCKVSGANKLAAGFADTAATLGHNAIVDGSFNLAQSAFGVNGFRALALDAKKADAAGEAPRAALPAVNVSERLVAFAGSLSQLPADVRLGIEQTLIGARRSTGAAAIDAGAGRVFATKAGGAPAASSAQQTRSVAGSPLGLLMQQMQRS